MVDLLPSLDIFDVGVEEIFVCELLPIFRSNIVGKDAPLAVFVVIRLCGGVT